MDRNSAIKLGKMLPPPKPMEDHQPMAKDIRSVHRDWAMENAIKLRDKPRYTG